MAALTSGSWTVRMLHATGTLQNANARQYDMSVLTKVKYVQAIMTLATGESPAAGIPWPDKSAFGFYRNLDNIVIANVRGATGGAATASGTYAIYEMNTTGQKVRPLKINYTSGNARSVIAMPTTVTLKGGTKFYVAAFGW